MTPQPITDRSGRVIAYLNTANDTRHEIRDTHNGLLGWYNPKLGKTFDRSGGVVSNSGDMRTSLIPPDR
jgi:hypothetical protein